MDFDNRTGMAETDSHSLLLGRLKRAKQTFQPVGRDATPGVANRCGDLSASLLRDRDLYSSLPLGRLWIALRSKFVKAFCSSSGSPQMIGNLSFGGNAVNTLTQSLCLILRSSKVLVSTPRMLTGCCLCENCPRWTERLAMRLIILPVVWEKVAKASVTNFGL